MQNFRPTTPLFNLKIVSPRRVFFEGPVQAVSSKNSAGKFDILPGHANFVTMILNQPIIVQTPNQKPLTFQFPLAIIYASKNRVSIFTDIQLEKLTG